MTETDKVLTHILAIFFNQPSVGLEEHVSPVVSRFMSLRTLFDEENYFLNPVSTDASAFVIQRFPEFIFSLDEQARVFVQKGRKKILFEGTLNALLVTEFSLWLYYLKEREGLTLKSNFKKYPLLRQIGILLFKEDEYPNKIWIHKENQFVVVVLGLEQELYIFSNNEFGLLTINQSFGTTANSDKKSSPYQTELLENAQILENRLYSQLYSKHLSITVPIVISAAEEKVPFDNEFIRKCRDFILCLTIRDYVGIIESITENITEAAYSQSNYEATSSSNHKLLKKDLRLSVVQFDAADETIVAVFSAPAIFQNDKIYVQLNFDKQIEDITIQGS